LRAPLYFSAVRSWRLSLWTADARILGYRRRPLGAIRRKSAHSEQRVAQAQRGAKYSDRTL